MTDQSPIHLKVRHEISIIWNVEDVMATRPDLNEDQAEQVLLEVDKHYDSEVGINWEVIHNNAKFLFGEAPDQGDDQ